MMAGQDPSADSTDFRESVGRRIYKSLKWNMVKLDGSTREKFSVLKELGYDGVELDSPGGVDAAEAVAASRRTTGVSVWSSGRRGTTSSQSTT